MKSVSKSSRVQSNLLQQNCYVRDVTRTIDLNSPAPSESSYLSLDEVVDDNGVKIVSSPVPYPITPDYVASFADSTDYRRDPAGAIANGVTKANLNDCTDFQNIMAMDSAAQLALYKQLQDKFSKVAAATKSVTVPSVNSNNNKEVDNNG